MRTPPPSSSYCLGIRNKLVGYETHCILWGVGMMTSVLQVMTIGMQENRHNSNVIVLAGTYYLKILKTVGYK